MNTIGLDTIAGAKLLQVRFGSSGAFQPDRAVMHGDRRARFIRMSDGAAIIRHWDDSHPVAVPLESLSLPPADQPEPSESKYRPAWRVARGGLRRRSRRVIPVVAARVKHPPAVP